MSRSGLALVYVGVAILVAIIILVLSQDVGSRYLAAFLGSVLITIGWIVASENTIKNAQRQQSVSIVLYYNSDKTGQEHRATIVEELPDPKTVLTPGDVVPSFDLESDKLLRAIDYELNFFEFVAVAVRREVLHEGPNKGLVLQQLYSVAHFSAALHRTRPVEVRPHDMVAFLVAL